MADLNIELIGGFFIRFMMNLIVLFILARYIFYPKNGQKKMIFTYLTMGMVIFLVGTLLDKIGSNMGFAIGLFAIFSIIRFRTAPMEVKELSYLFLVVGISLINSLVDVETYNLMVPFILNALILPTTYFIELYKPRKNISKKQIAYIVSDLEIINNNKLLLEEIKRNTKINVFKVEIRKINATKKELNLWIYYAEQ